MKIHMYEFRADDKKLRCSCGWDKKLKAADSKLISKMFTLHCADVSAKAP